MSFQIIAPEYLPASAYFLPFIKSDIVIIADHIQYKKRSTFTRAGSLKNNLKLTIPVKNKGFGQPLFDKEIAYIENWNHNHLKSIYHQYHMFPYFDDYYFKLRDLYNHKHTYLNKFLFTQISLLLRELKITCKLILSSDEGFSDSLEEDLIRFSINNSIKIFVYNDLDVQSGYINLKRLHDKNIQTRALPKYQDNLFSQLNIIELLFQYGPEAAFKIRKV